MTDASLTDDVLHRLLDRSADVTLLIEGRSGRVVRRWYDPATSRLQLPESPAARVITWIHPDDLPAVLDVMAVVAHDGGTRSTLSRLRPDRPELAGHTLRIAAHDASDILPTGLLIQAWIVEPDDAPAGPDSIATISSLAEAAPVGLQVRSANGTVSFENSRFIELVASGRPVVEDLIVAALARHDEAVEDIEVDHRCLRLRVVPTWDDAGHLLLAVASLEDVTSQRAAEASRFAAEGLFRAVFDGSPVATGVMDLDGCLVQVNDALAMICGRSAEDLIARSIAEITHPDDRAVDAEMLVEVLSGRRRGYQIEKRFLHRSGHPAWVELTVSTVCDAAGSATHLVLHAADISGRKALTGVTGTSGDLAYWATHDHLTGLPNRRYLDTFLTAGASPRRRSDDRLVVLFLDLDDFKPVNDQHGHQTGDEVLRVIARRLRGAAREDELVARYGGDEFVVVTTRARTAYDVSLLAERVLGAVSTPILGLADAPIQVGASIGIGHGGADEDPSMVLRRADAASYRAKRDGKGRISLAAELP